MKNNCMNCTFYVREGMTLNSGGLGVVLSYPACLKNINIATGGKADCKKFCDKTSKNSCIEQGNAFEKEYSFGLGVRNFLTYQMEKSDEELSRLFMGAGARFKPEYLLK